MFFPILHIIIFCIFTQILVDPLPQKVQEAKGLFDILGLPHNESPTTSLIPVCLCASQITIVQSWEQN